MQLFQLATPAVQFPAPAMPLAGTPPLSLTLMLGLTCCALGVVVGVLVLGFVLSTSKKNEAKHDQETGPDSK